jgi:dihydroorotate dehydrogenase electron transfer subunit
VQARYCKNRVIENIRISGNIYRMVVEGDLTVRPGQFFMLRAWTLEPILSRPISVCDIDEKRLVFLYEIRGEGTRILGSLKKDDKIELLGPLGNGFNTDEIKGKVAIVAGGIGIAPMLLTAKTIKSDKLDLYVGFREESYILDEFKSLVDNIYLATDYGTEGYKGFVTDIFNPENYNCVLICGPEIMMKKVVEKCNEAGVTSYVSMESRMACGVGACLVCTCKTSDGMKRTCKDGPVFLGKDVIFSA